jgi:hypothetical protein
MAIRTISDEDLELMEAFYLRRERDPAIALLPEEQAAFERFVELESRYRACRTQGDALAVFLSCRPKETYRPSISELLRQLPASAPAEGNGGHRKA